MILRKMKKVGGDITNVIHTVKYKILFGFILSLVLGLSFFIFKIYIKADTQVPETNTGIQVLEYFTKKISFGELGLLEVEREDYLTLDQGSKNNFEKEKIYTSEPIKTDLRFNAYTIRWKADTPKNTEIFVDGRTSIDGVNWDDWKTFLDPVNDVDDSGRDDMVGVNNGKLGAYTYGDLFFTDQNSGETNFVQFKISLVSYDGILSPSLDEIVIESIDTVESNDSEISKAEAASAPKVISRAGWGANESWMTWTPEYREPENFFIHHTVSMNNDPNPKATIRAIYYYHAISRDWGDIGYNYLVDQRGNIYEGRRGGNGVVGGHVLGYNYGSIGVSLLGDFHPGSTGRGNGSSYLTSAAKSKLADLIAWRGFENKINPLGTWKAGGNYPGTKKNVSGHRDSGATSCPGDYLYSALSSVRQNAYNKYTQFVDYRLIHDTNSGKVYAYFEEENQIRWIHDPDVFKAYGFSYSKIEDYNDISEFTTGPTLYNLMQGSSGKVYWVENKSKHWIINAKTFDAWGFDWNNISTLPDNFVNNISGSSDLSNIVTSTSTPKVYLLDGGNKVWIQDAVSFVSWGFDWSNITWINNSQLSIFPETDFTVNKLFKTGNDSAYYLSNDQKYHEISNLHLLDAWGLNKNQVEIISIDFINNYLELSAKSLSNLVDYDGYVYLVDSGNIRHVPNENTFINWGFDWDEIIDIDKTIFKNMFPTPVSSLTNLIAAIGGDKVYLVNDGQKIWIRSSFEFLNKGYRWRDVRFLSSDLVSSLPTVAGEGARLYKKESDSVKAYFLDSLGIHHIPDTAVFKAWSFVSDDIVTISDYEFNALTPSFDLSYLVVKEGGGKVYFLNNGTKHWITSPAVFKAWGFDWGRISVVPEDYLNSFSDGKDLTNLVHVSPKVYLVDQGSLRWIENENVFNAWGFSWSDYIDLTSQVKVSLGLTSGDSVNGLVHEYGKVNVLINGSKHWLPSSSTFFGWGYSAQDITFDLDQLVKEKTKGADIPNPKKAIVRSGAITRLRNSSNQILRQVSSNQKIYLGYSGGKYLASSKPDYFQFSNNNYRVDSNSGVVEVASYNDIPSWNTNLNDNKFRGFIELKHSSTSNKAWVVNELHIEDYLKGIAEASSSAPFEHLKTMSVAARSYVYYHYSNGGKHSGEPFHLKNSRHGNGDDQVYKGYGLEARWSDLKNAVNQTSGKVVTRNGSPVITPYFSRSDGRTRSWSEVWGGDISWCISVSDSDSNGMTKLGHGVGLPGYGASKRAERGNSYQTILSYYYTGTGLGNVDNPSIQIAIYEI